MSGGRPRTPIGQHGEIWMTMRGRKHVANTWVRDQDGKLRQATAIGSFVFRGQGPAQGADRRARRHGPQRPAQPHQQLHDTG